MSPAKKSHLGNSFGSSLWGLARILILRTFSNLSFWRKLIAFSSHFRPCPASLTRLTSVLLRLEQGHWILRNDFHVFQVLQCQYLFLYLSYVPSHEHTDIYSRTFWRWWEKPALLLRLETGHLFMCLGTQPNEEGLGQKPDTWFHVLLPALYEVQEFLNLFCLSANSLYCRDRQCLPNFASLFWESKEKSILRVKGAWKWK